MIETIITTPSSTCLRITEWEEGGAWILHDTGGTSISTMLTASNLDQLIKGLQAIQEETK